MVGARRRRRTLHNYHQRRAPLVDYACEIAQCIHRAHLRRTTARNLTQQHGKYPKTGHKRTVPKAINTQARHVSRRKKKQGGHWLTHIVVTIWKTVPPEKTHLLIRALAEERTGTAGEYVGHRHGHTVIRRGEDGENQMYVRRQIRRRIEGERGKGESG